MEAAIKIVEAILYVCIILLPVTTLLLIKTVKKENLKLIQGAVTNPILPNLDLNFFSKLQSEYTRITGNYSLAIINKLSLHFGLIGFFLLFALVIIDEVSTY